MTAASTASARGERLAPCAEPRLGRSLLEIATSVVPHLALPVVEYLRRSRGGRAAYRVCRHPLMMFSLGPVFAMMIRARIATRTQWQSSQLVTLAQARSVTPVGGAVPGPDPIGAVPA